MEECVTGDIRLVNGVNNTDGRVEVCVDMQWASVCDNGWTNKDAEVVCNQLGLPIVGKFHNNLKS